MKGAVVAHVALVAVVILAPIAAILGARHGSEMLDDRGDVRYYAATVAADARRVEAAAKRIDEHVAQLVVHFDAVSAADRAAETRTDSLRCALLYLADTLGKRRELSSGQWGLRGAPAGTSWDGWPEDWDRCSVCAAGYECNSMQRDGQR